MKPRHQVSRGAIELVKQFEGYRRNAAQLPDGRWTIGYGHTKSARQGVEVSEADAEALLLYDLIQVAAAVDDATFAPLTQNQFDALTAFAFNIGVENFLHSAVLRRVNEGQMLQAASNLDLWRKAEFQGREIVIDSLVRRRAFEKSLFLTPEGEMAPAPSAVLRPRLDVAAAEGLLREPAHKVIVPLEGEVAVAQAVEPPPEPFQPAAAVLRTEEAAEALAARLEALLPSQPEAPEPEAPSRRDTLPFEPRQPEIAPPQEHSAVSQPFPAAEALPRQPRLTAPPMIEPSPSVEEVVRPFAPGAMAADPEPAPLLARRRGKPSLPIWFLIVSFLLGVLFFSLGGALLIQNVPHGAAPGLAGIVLMGYAVAVLLGRLSQEDPAV